MLSCPVNGEVIFRDFVAGFFTVLIFKRPGNVNCPAARFLRWRSITTASSSKTAPTSFFVRPVFSDNEAKSCVLVNGSRTAVVFPFCKKCPLELRGMELRKRAVRARKTAGLNNRNQAINPRRIIMASRLKC